MHGFRDRAFVFILVSYILRIAALNGERWEGKERDNAVYANAAPLACS